MKIIAAIIIFIIFILFWVLRGVLNLANRKNHTNLNIRNIAHDWIASMPYASQAEQLEASNELIKASFNVLSSSKLADYNRLMSITDKQGFNASNFIQHTFKTALNLQKQKKISLDGLNLENDFGKEMLLFFTVCLTAVLLNTELDGYELLNRIALESKGYHMPWKPI